MNNPRDFRIGNMVSVGVITGIYETRPGVYSCQINGDFAFDLNDIEPVELSPERLKDFGFRPFGKDWSQSGVIIHTRKRGFVISKSVPEIKFVHQLQNYFYARTGKEIKNL